MGCGGRGTQKKKEKQGERGMPSGPGIKKKQGAEGKGVSRELKPILTNPPGV